MKKSRKMWLGVGAFVLVGGEPAVLPATAQETGVTMPAPAASPLAAAVPGMARVAQAASGGEGGEGGEAGINVDAAERDPVEYSVALQVIAAHYHAGMAAYEAKEQEAGAQMFAHGLSEIYVEMEDVFRRRGVTDLGKSLEAAVNAAAENKPVDEVRRRVQDVFAALAAAEKRAPKSDESAQAVKAKVTAELIDRAAAQYALIGKDTSLEAYLDGLGFARAAREQSRDVLPWLAKADAGKAAALQRALELADKAYPGIKRPSAPAPAADLLVAASAAKLAVSNLR